MTGFDRAALAARLRHLHGTPGYRWALGIEESVDRIARRWQLVVHGELPSGYSYVAHVSTPDGRPLILKVGFPGSAALIREAWVLDHARGRGYSSLLAHEPASGALLVEQLGPGDPVELDARGNRPADALVIAGLIARMWHGPAPSPELPTTADWTADLGRVVDGAAPAPDGLDLADLRHATSLAAALEASAPATPLLLHGDLHHGNVLSDHRDGHRAIDPKGVLGELAYEVGASLRNPYPQLAEVPELASVLRRRCETFAEALGLPPHRIALWAWVQLVLSAVWACADQDAEWQHYVRRCEPSFRTVAAELEHRL